LSRKLWLVAFLILIVALLFRHGGTPMTLSFPSAAKITGNEVRVPVKVAVPSKEDAPYWILSRRGEGGPYLVTVFENGKSIAQFSSNNRGTVKSDGTTYSAAGRIQVVNTVYNASAIHIDPDGHSGYILMTSDSAAAENTTTNNNGTSP
jgi:hypothetical protein